ncbi:MAG: M23 family metallopeptidase [Bacteroidales bacterium]|nr:M23 family metallopeptidase [Bacteroidales bacterium]
MKQWVGILLMCVLLAGCRMHPSKPVTYAYGIPVDSFRVDTGIVKKGQTLGAIFQAAGVDRQQFVFVSSLTRKQFDPRVLRPDKQYLLFYQVDEQQEQHLQYFVYNASIREAYVFHLGDSMYVEKQVKPIETRHRSAKVAIESSLWNAMVDNHLPVDLALDLSEIYAWTIDFFALQPGDSVSMYFEEFYVDSVRYGVGRIYAANFYHGKQWQEAFFYNRNNISNYFDGKGNSLKKAFLKAPLNYRRISSTFSYARKHPVYKIVRPHTGVDYAAPVGTPVVAIGDGVVTFMAYKGGGGNTIKIRHNSTYTTAYLHLSKYAKNLKVGQHVKQGEVIGYVGSTGASTGPHLDFRVWKNGIPIDPLKMVSPPAEPIPSEYKENFSTRVAEYRKHL